MYQVSAGCAARFNSAYHCMQWREFRAVWPGFAFQKGTFLKGAASVDSGE